MAGLLLRTSCDIKKRLISRMDTRPKLAFRRHLGGLQFVRKQDSRPARASDDYQTEDDISPIETCPKLDPFLVYREAKRRFAEARKKRYLYINGLGEKLKGPSLVADQ